MLRKEQLVQSRCGSLVVTAGLPSTDVDLRPGVSSLLSQLDSENIMKHHEGKNADVVDLLTRKRVELAREMARDQKAYKKNQILSYLPYRI